MYLSYSRYKLYYEEFGTDKAGTIICLHGWLGSHKDFDFMRMTNLGRDYRIICMDFLGFGKSSRPWHEKFYTISSFVDQMSAVAGHFKVERPILIAFSMGGIVALEYAASHGAGKLILACPPLKHAWLNKLLRFFGRIRLSKTMHSLVLTLKQKNFVEEISKLNVPTHIFYGESDLLVKFDPQPVENLRNVSLIKYNGGHRTALPGLKYILEDNLNSPLAPTPQTM